MKKSTLITSVICGGFLIGIFTINGLAAASTNEITYQSQGKIVFDNATEDTSDDVIFDANDFVQIDNMITSGKTSVAASVNAYPNTTIPDVPTFSEIASGIDTLTNVPDVYYYDKATEGEDCVRYIKEGDAYYPCDEHGVKTSDSALSGSISVVTKDDTTEPAEGEIQLVQYTSTGSANLSAGSAGYADKTFVLGSGADNIDYRNQAKATVIQLSDTENKSFSIDVKDICAENNLDYTSLTDDNFLLVISGYTASVAATQLTSYGNGGYAPWGADTKNPITKTYNASSGVFECNLPENYFTKTSGPWNLAPDGGSFANYYHYAKVVRKATVIPYLVVY